MPVKVKICGLTNLEDAQVALDAGADFLGFILAESPRRIAPNEVARILTRLDLPQHVRTVGVFVNTPIDQVSTILAETGLDLAQLQGDETESDVATLQGRGYKALRPAGREEAEAALAFAAYPGAHAPQVMVDAYHKDKYGGTGKLADWSLAGELALHARMMLAGGLTPDNVQSAIAAVKPWAVDVGSGVEREPGRKDHDKVRAFVAGARRRA